jgi:perosamine synthetase
VTDTEGENMTIAGKRRVIAIAAPAMDEAECEAIREPLLNGWLTQGPKVQAFEAAFATLHDVRHAIASTSCTTALHLALVALDIGPGEEVVVPAFTWVSTANAVLYCGAIPVFADVDRQTFNVTPESVKASLTPSTRAVIIVHLFGLCADVDAIRKVLPADVKLIEDAACAAGAVYRGRPAGGLADIAVFSFHPRKAITTGEGGMVTTNNDELAARVRVLRNHGASVPEEVRHHGSKPYLLPEFETLGFNYRMTDLQAAIGMVQLGKLARFVAERSVGAANYRRELAGINWLVLPDEPTRGRHAWQSFVTYVDPERAPRRRNDVMELLQQRGISTRPGTHAVHMLAYYRRRFGFASDDFPGARDCDHNSMAIPLHNRMTPEDYAYVIAALRAL